MKLLKKIIAFTIVAIMGVTSLGLNVFAENLNYSIHSPRNNQCKDTINVATGTFDCSWTATSSSSANYHGVGWSTGKASRKIGYNFGIFNHTSGGNGCTFLDFYGWTRNSLVEYYIFENWVNYVPNDGTYAGTLNTDGADYKYYYKSANAPNIDGSGPFKQIISVRDSSKKRTSGTITFQNHVNAWASNANTKLGSSWSYQVLCAEGYNSNGRASGSVWEA